MKKTLLGLMAVSMMLVLSATSHAAQVKEWSVLVFLNGHNNLDSFGFMNMDHMKQVGSSDQVNVIVQWASMKNKDTQRVYVEKNKLTVIEKIKPVDMGDYHELVNFVKWAHQNYPAKKYFIDIWNHGNGWHRVETIGEIKPTDISYDDISGHHITTEQMGLAMSEIAAHTGSKVELVGTDACLMAMAEVAAEISESTKYYAGSQETEPGEGWPYAKFLAPLVAKPTMDGAELAKTLSKEYLAAYNGGIFGKKAVTFSAYDLSKMDQYNDAVKALAEDLLRLDPAGLKAAAQAVDSTQAFASTDYKDLKDYMKLVGKSALSMERQAEFDRAANDFIIANNVSPRYSRATGVSVWLPSNSYEYNDYAQRYQNMKFNKATGWGNFLEAISKFR